MIIIYSGFEQKQNLEKLIGMLEKGFKVGGVLVSYLHINENQLEYLKKIKSFGAKIMLDSGAHSFLIYHGSKKGEGTMGHEVSEEVKQMVDNDKTDEYVNKLITFVKENQELFDIYVELDIAQIVGQEKADKWREDWKQAGLKPMYVWHGEDMEVLKKWMESTDKIGLGGSGKGSKEKRIGIAQQLKSFNSKLFIHGFAMTGAEDIKIGAKVIDSVDSTSWTSCARFGNYYIAKGKEFSGVRIEEMELKKAIQAVKEELNKVGLDSTKILAGDMSEGNFWNLFQFERYMCYINKMFEQSKLLNQSNVTFGTPGQGGTVNKTRLKHGIYSKFKSVHCDICYLKDRCEHHEQGSLCFWRQKLILKFKTRDVETIKDLVWEELIDTERRLQFAKHIEAQEGGTPDKAVERVITTKNTLLGILADLYKEPITLTQTNVQNINVTKFDAVYQAFLNKKADETKAKKVIRIEEHGT